MNQPTWPAVPTDAPLPDIPDWPALRQGDHGPLVFALQHLLRFHGQTLISNGIFGVQTRTAVINFQSLNGLGADGVVGPQTWSALIRGAQVRESNHGDAVRAAQYLLDVMCNYDVTVDGIFGPRTNAAVRDFQFSHGLIANGILSPQTWQALIASGPQALHQ